MAVTDAQMANISLYSNVAGMFTSAAGSYFDAQSKASSLQFQANMADINAQFADLNAHTAERGAQGELRKGNRQVAALTMRAGQLKSRQRASMAANGIDLGSGSAAEVQASTDIMKEIDKNTIHANAIQSAWGYRTQGMNAQIQATNQRSGAAIGRASASGISPIGAASSSLLSSAGGVADSWYKYNKATKGGKH